MCINPIEYCWSCWSCFSPFVCTHIFVVEVSVLASPQFFFCLFLFEYSCLWGTAFMHFVCLLRISWIFNFWLGATIIVPLHSVHSQWALFKVFHTKTSANTHRKVRKRERETEPWTIMSTINDIFIIFIFFFSQVLVHFGSQIFRLQRNFALFFFVQIREGRRQCLGSVLWSHVRPVRLFAVRCPSSALQPLCFVIKKQ